MNFKVSNEAAEWYKNEMDLEQGDYVHIMFNYTVVYRLPIRTIL